jgi:hypothetical protein
MRAATARSPAAAAAVAVEWLAGARRRGRGTGELPATVPVVAGEPVVVQAHRRVRHNWSRALVTAT